MEENNKQDAGGEEAHQAAGAANGGNGGGGADEKRETGSVGTGVEDDDFAKATLAAIKTKERNPFKLPPEKEYSKLLQDAKLGEKMKFKRMLREPVHRKVPLRRLSPPVAVKSLPPVRLPKERPPSPTAAVKSDPEFLQAMAKCEKYRNMENLNTFVNNKREMFLIQYMMGVKRDAMLRLNLEERKREQRLDLAEKWLEEDAIKFNDFLRFNDREAVDAVKQAEHETKIKLDKVADIKKINVHIVNIKGKIGKLEDVLTEYKLYCKFLTSVAPQEWKEQKTREKIEAAEQKGI